jgi:hypothetical protein
VPEQCPIGCRPCPILRSPHAVISYRLKVPCSPAIKGQYNLPTSSAAGGSRGWRASRQRMKTFPGFSQHLEEPPHPTLDQQPSLRRTRGGLRGDRPKKDGTCSVEQGSSRLLRMRLCAQRSNRIWNRFLASLCQPCQQLSCSIRIHTKYQAKESKLPRDADGNPWSPAKFELICQPPSPPFVLVNLGDGVRPPRKVGKLSRRGAKADRRQRPRYVRECRHIS